MKIVSIGYYDDFSRFFLEWKRKFIQHNGPEDNWNHISLTLSGYLYFLFRSRSVSFLPIYVCYYRLKNKIKLEGIAQKQKIYKGINLESVIYYYYKTDSSASWLDLKTYAIAYIDLIERYLIESKPDLIILSGDKRMCIEIFDFYAQKLKIKKIYFEQGPFNTTILDSKGVNANASIRELHIKDCPNKENPRNNIYRFLNREKSTKYNRNKVYRFTDYLLDWFLKRIDLYHPDFKIISEPKKNNINLEHLRVSIIPPNTFLLVLQVPQDVNMIYHSPFYDNHFSIVKDVYENLPEKINLVVREHPLYKGRYEQVLYNYLIKHNIMLDEGKLSESLENSKAVIVNNSMVGIEALAKAKSLIALGNSYYDFPEICLKMKSREDLKYILNKATTFKPKKTMVEKSLEVIFFQFLIDGHFKDKKINSESLLNFLSTYTTNNPTVI